MSNEDLGVQIRKYRLANIISQTELGIILGVSQPTIGSWEKGAYIPKGDKRDYLLKLLNKEDKKEITDTKALNEIISHQRTIIELLQDKIKGMGGTV
jgi:transcriptional regulator with XRE-family HTH domain